MTAEQGLWLSYESVAWLGRDVGTLNQLGLIIKSGGLSTLCAIQNDEVNVVGCQVVSFYLN